jgi:hypothetical protein
MQTISMFYGIIIRMYCAPNEHNPPHIHVYYQDDKAVIDIKKVELTQGKLHKKKLRLVYQMNLLFKVYTVYFTVLI